MWQPAHQGIHLRLGAERYRLWPQAEKTLVVEGVRLADEEAAALLAGRPSPLVELVRELEAIWREEGYQALRYAASTFSRAQASGQSGQDGLSMLMESLSEDILLREWAARFKVRSERAPRRLLADPVVSVAESAAGNARLPQELRRGLTRDCREEVRLALCANPELTGEELAVLTRDENPEVRFRALLASACDAELARPVLRTLPPKRRAEVAHWAESKDVLELLLRDRSLEVRCELARRWQHPRLLERLAADRCVDVRINVAATSRSAELLLRMASDRSPEVREEVIRNRSVFEAALEAVVQAGGWPAEEARKVLHQRLGAQPPEATLCP